MTIHLDPSFISFDDSQTNRLKFSARSFISDFISLGKSFMNIKNNKGLSTDP